MPSLVLLKHRLHKLIEARREMAELSRLDHRDLQDVGYPKRLELASCRDVAEAPLVDFTALSRLVRRAAPSPDGSARGKTLVQSSAASAAEAFSGVSGNFSH